MDSFLGGSNGASRYQIPDQLLLDFLDGVSDAAEEFVRVASPFLLALARRRAPDLPADLRRDIVSETFAGILTIPKSAFNPAIGPAKAFLAVQIRSAIRRVRANYCSPGRRTRALSRTATGANSPPLIVPIEELTPADQPRDRHSPQRLDAYCDAKTVLAKAPANVAVALQRIYVMGDRVNDVAEALGVSRFTMARAITAFSNQMCGMV